MKEVLQILKSQRIALLTMLTIIIFILSAWIPLLAPIGFVLLNVFFDIIGYRLVLYRNELNSESEYAPEPTIVVVRGYRIIQFIFMAMTLIIAKLLFGWTGFTGTLLLLWTANQDLLYYYFLNFQLDENWTWLSWSPAGMLKQTLKKKQVLIQAAIGIVAYITLELQRMGIFIK